MECRPAESWFFYSAWIRYPVLVAGGAVLFGGSAAVLLAVFRGAVASAPRAFAMLICLLAVALNIAGATRAMSRSVFWRSGEALPVAARLNADCASLTTAISKLARERGTLVPGASRMTCQVVGSHLKLALAWERPQSALIPKDVELQLRVDSTKGWLLLTNYEFVKAVFRPELTPAQFDLIAKKCRVDEVGECLTSRAMSEMASVPHWWFFGGGTISVIGLVLIFFRQGRSGAGFLSLCAGLASLPMPLVAAAYGFLF